MEKSTRTIVKVQLTDKNSGGRFNINKVYESMIHGKIVAYRPHLEWNEGKLVESTRLSFIKKIISMETETYFPEPKCNETQASQIYTDRAWNEEIGQYFYSAR